MHYLVSMNAIEFRHRMMLLDSRLKQLQSMPINETNSKEWVELINEQNLLVAKAIDLGVI